MGIFMKNPIDDLAKYRNDINKVRHAVNKISIELSGES